MLSRSGDLSLMPVLGTCGHLANSAKRDQ